MRGRGWGFNKPSMICQVHGKNGHMVLHHYHRFNITYIDSVGTPSGFRSGQFHTQNERSNSNAKANIGQLAWFGGNAMPWHGELSYGKQ